MRKIVTLSLAAAALAGAGGIAYAQADQAPPTTRAEVEQRSAEMFARMDANDDGKLDQTDRAARRAERGADGEARSKAAFDRLDADKSGAISFEEFAALREQRQELGRERRRGPGRHGSGPARFGARNTDTNRDGTVTQAEFASAALARFDRVDVDKDGTISADERPARRTMRRFRDAG